MYCQNCGAQNPDTAATCGNCGFNLKPAAPASKFKGTMLMVNSPFAPGAPGAPGGPGAPGTPAPPGAPAPGAADPGPPSFAESPTSAAKRQMKGTIVGIAPPAPGAAPAPMQPMPAPVPQPPVAEPQAFSPPGGGSNVNPMGSTFVADGPMPAFPPPSPQAGAAFGAPMAAPEAAPPTAPAANFGAPPAAAPDAFSNPGPYGAAPAPFGGAMQPPPGAPPAGSPYGAPPSDFGAPPAAPLANLGAGFGAQPAPPPGALVPSPGAPMVPTGPTAISAGPVGTIRNPVTTLIMMMVCFLIGCAQLKALEDELHTFLGDGKKSSILWFLFPLIPILGMPKLIGEARAKAGTPVQGDGNLILYIFLGAYMIPTDANQIWQHLGARSS